jgi:hypothetical protein
VNDITYLLNYVIAAWDNTIFQAIPRLKSISESDKNKQGIR